MQQEPTKNQGLVRQTIEQAQQEVIWRRESWYRVFQLMLFALLAFYVHIHPILGVDVAITHEFQEN